jgi:hypothetical protein
MSPLIQMGDYAILHLKKYRTVAFMALYQNQLRIRIFLLVGMTLLILRRNINI